MTTAEKAAKQEAKQEVTASLLPTTKTAPSIGLANAKIMVWGPPKIGKSTFAAGLDPDHTLFLATEPGLNALEVFSTQVNTWNEFRKVCAELAQGKHDFRMVVIDTVDELQRMCTEYILASLNSKLKTPMKGHIHSSDFDFGKAYDAVTEEFRLRIAKLCSLGFGVVFISHAKEGKKKSRTGEELTIYAPDIGAKGSRQWLLGHVDYILFATADGEDRVIRTQPTETYEAGGRLPNGAPLPDPLPLEGPAFRKAIEAAGKKVAA